MDYEFKRKGPVMDQLLDWLEEFIDNPMGKINLPNAGFGGVIKTADQECIFPDQKTFWISIPARDMTLENFGGYQLLDGHLYIISTEDGENFECENLGRIEYHIKELATTPAEELMELADEGETIVGRHTATFNGFTWDIHGVIQVSITQDSTYKFYSFTMAARVSHYTDLSVSQVLYQRELLVRDGAVVQDEMKEIPLYI